MWKDAEEAQPPPLRVCSILGKKGVSISCDHMGLFNIPIIIETSLWPCVWACWGSLHQRARISQQVPAQVEQSRFRSSSTAICGRTGRDLSQAPRKSGAYRRSPGWARTGPAFTGAMEFPDPSRGSRRVLRGSRRCCNMHRPLVPTVATSWQRSY